MAEEGNGFPWHFDTNNFTVTLAIQNAETGGAFEYAPRIREGDENFAEVSRVLEWHIRPREGPQPRAGRPPDLPRPLLPPPRGTAERTPAALCGDFLLRRRAQHGGRTRARATTLRPHPAHSPRAGGAAVGPLP